MRKRLIAIGSALALTLLSSSAASALTVGDAFYVGVIIDGIPASPGDEINYINSLIQVAPNTLDPTCNLDTSEACDRTLSNQFAANTLPLANLTLAQRVESGTLTSFTAGDYEYVLAKYGSEQSGGGSHVWYIATLDGTQSLPALFGGTGTPGISHYSLYNGTVTTVPDGGTTAALLGLSMVGLGLIRRRINL